MPKDNVSWKLFHKIDRVDVVAERVGFEFTSQLSATKSIKNTTS